MNIDIIASSSSGNCIFIEDSSSKILLDCGLPFNKLSRSVSVSEIEAVFVTHSHMDHYRAAPELIRRGADVYMSRGTAEAKEAPPCLLAKHLRQIETENWKVLPFETEHDANESLGFLLQNKVSGNKYLYAVDTSVINYDFPSVNFYLIEANYAEDILSQGDYKPWLKNRVRRSHFSLEDLKTFLSTSDLSKTKEIWLLHLSNANSDEKRFIDEIQKITGVPTYAS